MGTNYYVRIGICKTCGRFEQIHLGKSSGGWRFAIELHPHYYRSFKEFKAFIQKREVRIYDEYGNRTTSKALIKLIKSKVREKSQPSFQSHFVFKDRNADLCNYEFC